jgi:RND family efflux transporter MFP subunit
MIRRAKANMVFVTLGIALFWSCASKHEGEQRKKVRVPAVVTRTLKKTDVRLEREYLVTLEAYQEAKIFARTSGYVLRILKDRGDSVRKGELLAVIEGEELSEMERQALAQIESVQAQLQYARENEARLKKLMEKQLVSQAELDNATTQVKSLDAQLRALQANFRATRTRRGYTEVRAPFDGFVLTRNVDVGALVGPQGVALFVVGDIQKIKAIVDVPQTDYGFIKPETEVSLRVDGLEQTRFTGKITRITPAFDRATRTMQVEMVFDNQDGVLKPGMFGRAKVLRNMLQGVIVVPALSVVRREDKAFVFIVENNIARQVEVELGETLPSGDAVVHKGLEEGQRLVVRGKDLIRDGIEVKEVQEGAETQRTGD